MKRVFVAALHWTEKVVPQKVHVSYVKAAALMCGLDCFKGWKFRGAFDSAKNHKRQRRKHQSVTAKREMSQTPKFV